jgi:hypothetical protein
MIRRITSMLRQWRGMRGAHADRRLYHVTSICGNWGFKRRYLFREPSFKRKGLCAKPTPCQVACPFAKNVACTTDCAFAVSWSVKRRSFECFREGVLLSLCQKRVAKYFEVCGPVRREQMEEGQFEAWMQEKDWVRAVTECIEGLEALLSLYFSKKNLLLLNFAKGAEGIVRCYLVACMPGQFFRNCEEQDNGLMSAARRLISSFDGLCRLVVSTSPFTVSALEALMEDLVRAQECYTTASEGWQREKNEKLLGRVKGALAALAETKRTLNEERMQVDEKMLQAERLEMGLRAHLLQLAGQEALERFEHDLSHEGL